MLRTNASPSRKQGNQEQSQTGWLERWLRLTAPEGAEQYDRAPSHTKREHLRRSGLTSLVAPLVFMAPLLLLQQASTDLITAVGIGVLMLMSVGALILNRHGGQVLAAVLLVGSMDIVIEGALVSAGIKGGGLGAGWLLTFDLFCIPLIAAGVLLSRRFLVLFAGLHIICILGNFYLLPHAQDLDALVQVWGPTIAYARPIIIQLVACGLCYLAVRSTDQAIVRAEKAETVAELERKVAKDRELLEVAATQLREALAAVGNGNYARRVHVGKGTILWEVGHTFNFLLERLGQTSGELQRTKEHLRQMAVTLDEAQSGKQPLWPPPSGTAADMILDRLRRQEAPSSKMQGVPGGSAFTSPQARNNHFPSNKSNTT